MAAARARLLHVMVDCRDPRRLASFWCELLGVEVAGELDDAFVFLTAPDPDAAAMAFQRVPEDKIQKNRVHPDLAVEDLEEVTAWVEANGGSLVAEHDRGGARWNVATDPEGNEFCLVRAGSS